jgi:hypothetical protein
MNNSSRIYERTFVYHTHKLCAKNCQLVSEGALGCINVLTNRRSYINHNNRLLGASVSGREIYERAFVYHSDNFEPRNTQKSVNQDYCLLHYLRTHVRKQITSRNHIFLGPLTKYTNARSLLILNVLS